MAFEPIRDGLDVVGRPNGRICLTAPAGRLYEEDYRDAILYLDFTPQGVRLYFSHPETETQEGRTVVLAQFDRYDRSLAMRLEAQKLVDVFLIQRMTFDGIQNFMAVCRVFR